MYIHRCSDSRAARAASAGRSGRPAPRLQAQSCNRHLTRSSQQTAVSGNAVCFVRRTARCARTAQLPQVCARCCSSCGVLQGTEYSQRHGRLVPFGLHHAAAGPLSRRTMEVLPAVQAVMEAERSVLATDVRAKHRLCVFEACRVTAALAGDVGRQCFERCLVLSVTTSALAA